MNEKTARRTSKPSAIEKPIMATLLLSADELGLLLRMLEQMSFPDPNSKHVAGNLQFKAMQAAQSAQAAENGSQPEE